MGCDLRPDRSMRAACRPKPTHGQGRVSKKFLRRPVRSEDNSACEETTSLTEESLRAEGEIDEMVKYKTSIKLKCTTS